MRRKLSDNSNNTLALLVMGAFIFAVVAAAITQWHNRKAAPPAEEQIAPIPIPITIDKEQVIEYDGSGNGDGSKEITEQRKEQFGIDKGVDLIVNADESLKIGDTTVSMQEIMDRIRLQRGDIVESNVAGTAAEMRSMVGNDVPSSKPKKAYGIYVVQPNDNIWNVHFKFLRDYLKQRGITLSPVSDEPTRHGFSSGIGKILKFSESMVHIYNLREQKLDVDLDFIHPLTKIVVFDMAQVLTILDQIDEARVNHIQFDGETLWIPAKQ